MENKRNRRSRRFETPSPDREVDVTQVETPNTGNGTLGNLNIEVQDKSGENSLEYHLTESTQISNEIQAWTQIMQQKNSDWIKKMKEMDQKLELILVRSRLTKVYRR